MSTKQSSSSEPSDTVSAQQGFPHRLRLFADQVAIKDPDGRDCTYEQLADSIERCREVFVDGGAETPRVVCVLPDHPSTMLVIAGLSEVATVIPINPKLTDAELENLIAESAADAILTRDSRPVFHRFAETYCLSEFTLEWHARDHFADCDILPLSQRSSEDVKIETIPGLVLLTSGSTGRPKRVPLPWTSLVQSAETIVETLQLSARDTVVHMLPMFHIGAVVDLFIAPLLSGGTIVFAHPISTPSLVQSVVENEATWFQAVPTILKSLLSTTDDETLRGMSRHLRFVRAVSAALPPDMHQMLEEKLGGVPIIQIYGMTETAGQIASNPLPPGMRKLGSVGIPTRIEVAILDRFANRAPNGSTGEVCVKGPTVMSSYEDTFRASHFHGDWLRTGDIGHIDDDGYLFLNGRVKEMINRGGEKISPTEIEQRLYAMTDIYEAAAFAVPHETLGEDVGVAVALREDVSLDEEAIKKRLAETLVAEKVPRRIAFYDSLPKLGSGKIDKTLLAQSHGARAPSADVIKPRSRLGDEVAEIWSKTLNCPVPKDHDDFFETNGDSLSAQTFILELEENLNLRLPGNLLYDAPTFGELEDALLVLQSQANPHPQVDDVYEAVRASTASWPGLRHSETGLAVGTKGVGSKVPFFFFGGILNDLANALDADRPCYMLRTLSGLAVKSDENNKKLAKYYADEIQTLQPEGALLLGGHCQGVLVAQLVAELLIARGRDIGMMVIIDRVIRGCFPYPATFIWSDTTHHSALNHFHEPERGLPSMFPKGSAAMRVGVRHEDVLIGEAAARIGAFIEPQLEAASQSDAAPCNVDGSDGIPVREKAYGVRMRVFAPRFGQDGEAFDVVVDVTNTSGETWQPTERSGFRLLAKWQRLGGKTIDNIIGVGDLTVPVAPGETNRVHMTLQFPRHRSPLMLYIDMVDDGICWFSDVGGSNPARHLMIPRFW